jgi:hypothetical protein
LQLGLWLFQIVWCEPGASSENNLCVFFCNGDFAAALGMRLFMTAAVIVVGVPVGIQTAQDSANAALRQRNA